MGMGNCVNGMAWGLSAPVGEGWELGSEVLPGVLHRYPGVSLMMSLPTTDGRLY
jgi:hypothetical protein